MDKEKIKKIIKESIERNKDKISNSIVDNMILSADYISKIYDEVYESEKTHNKERLKYLIKMRSSYKDIINNTQMQLNQVEKEIEELEGCKIIEKNFKTKSGKKINFKVKKLEDVKISGADKAKNALKRMRKNVLRL